MILRRDHIAGGIFIVAGAFVYAVSGDLPLGSMAMPGAGMLPKLAIGLMIAFGVVLLARAAESPPFTAIDWSDCGHALRVILVAALAIALYTTLGFILTMSLMLLGLLAVVERRTILPAVLFSVGVTVFAYLLFNTLLKSPLPRGLIGF